MFKEFIKETLTFDFDCIIFACSGGYDSTYMLLKLYDKFPNIQKRILYNNTGIEMKECQNLVYELSKKTNISLLETKLDKDIKINDVLKQSFLKLDDAKKLYDEHRYHKKVFPCCNILKHNPSKVMYKQIREEFKNPIVLSGIKKEDGKQRRIFLHQIQNKNTYIHYHKTNKIYYGYPLRDISQLNVDSFIETLSFKVKHSGCMICTVLLFNLTSEGERYIYSRNFYFNLTGNKWGFCNEYNLENVCWKK